MLIANCLKNNRSKSYCYISSGFGEKERGAKTPQYKVSKKSPSTNRVKATFILQRFHLDPFLILKTELFFLPVHITPFLKTKTDIFRLVFTLVLKNGSDYLLFVFALCSLFSSFPDYVSVFVCYQRF